MSFSENTVCSAPGCNERDVVKVVIVYHGKLKKAKISLRVCQEHATLVHNYEDEEDMSGIADIFSHLVEIVLGDIDVHYVYSEFVNSLFFVLNENNHPVPSYQPMMDDIDKRIIAKTQTINCLVSTVFLGLEHGTDGLGRPVLFETMIFNGVEDGYQRRYSTYKDAIQGHIEIVMWMEKNGVRV